jgi:hypothetical protein
VGIWNILPAFIGAILTGIFVFVFGTIIVWQNKNAFGAVFAIIGLLVSFGSFKINKFYLGRKNQGLVENNADRAKLAENNAGNIEVVTSNLQASETVNNSTKKKPFQPTVQTALNDPIRLRVNTIINNYHWQGKEFRSSETLWNNENSTRNRLRVTIQELRKNKFGGDIKQRHEKVIEELQIATKNLDVQKLQALTEESDKLQTEMLKKELAGNSNSWLDTELVKSKLNLDEFSLFCYMLDNAIIDQIFKNPNIDESIVADSLFRELDPRKFIDPLELKTKRYISYQSEIKIKGKLLEKIGILIDQKNYNELCDILLNQENQDVGKKFEPNVRNVYKAAEKLALMPFYIEHSPSLTDEQKSSYDLYSFTLCGDLAGYDWLTSPDNAASMLTWRPELGPVFFGRGGIDLSCMYEDVLDAKIKAINYSVNKGEMREDEARDRIENEKCMHIERLLKAIIAE